MGNLIGRSGKIPGSFLLRMLQHRHPEGLRLKDATIEVFGPKPTLIVFGTFYYLKDRVSRHGWGLSSCYCAPRNLQVADSLLLLERMYRCTAREDPIISVVSTMECRKQYR